MPEEEYYRLKSAGSGAGEKRAEFPTPMIQSDIEPYISPLSDPAKGAAGRQWITSRSQLREHLKENNCRIVEPSEKKDFVGE